MNGAKYGTCAATAKTPIKIRTITMGRSHHALRTLKKSQMS